MTDIVFYPSSFVLCIYNYIKRLIDAFLWVTPFRVMPSFLVVLWLPCFKFSRLEKLGFLQEV